MSSHLAKLASLWKARTAGAHVPASMQGRKAALRAAWMSHSVKRALAAVTSASDADYEALGWERGALIAKLQWLRGEIAEARRIQPSITLARAARPVRGAA